MAFADGDIWAATRFGGAVRWNIAGGFTRYLFPQDGIGGNEVVFTAVDPSGRVWCATLEGGVSVYDGAGWVVYDTENSGLSHNNVNGIAFGKAGEIWLATLGGGVSMFDGRNWMVFDEGNSGIAGDFVWYVDVDARGRLWCGCMEGLSVFDGKTWYTYPDTYNVHCVAFDSQGRTWFGDGMGLNLVDGAGVVAVSREQLGAYTPATSTQLPSIRWTLPGLAPQAASTSMMASVWSTTPRTSPDWEGSRCSWQAWDRTVASGSAPMVVMGLPVSMASRGRVIPRLQAQILWGPM